MLKSILGTVAALGLAALVTIVFLKEPAKTLTVSDARAELHSAEQGEIHVFLSIQNGAIPDKLIGASSDVAREAILVTKPQGTAVPIPANSMPVLSADGVYVALSGVQETLEEGRFIPISLEFETAGSVSSRAIISAPLDPHAAHRAMMVSGTMGIPLFEDGQDFPTAHLNAEQAADRSWNLTLDVTNFIFDADTEEPVHLPGHGHAHLYINGMKIQRMYGTSATIGQLPPGTYIVRVSLNTNDHRPYTNAVGPVEASVSIVVE